MTSPQAAVEVPAATKRLIVTLAIANIHPDPFQPRIHPDAELADSIKSQGLLQPFSVEPLQLLDATCPDCDVTFAELAAIGGQYMINDGERRWRGSKAAGLKEVDVEIVPVSSEGKRLLRQVTANTGKPLTVIEEAIAYRSIMVAEGWTQAELARHLGKPKSVVGDRIRLIELDPAWLELISDGRLQVSHAPVISTFAAVPSEYQKKAAANLLADYRAKRFLDEGDKIPVGEIRHLLYVAFRDYIKPISDVRGYKGPTIQIAGRYGNFEGKTEKYAADIKLWRPIFNKHQRAHRKSLQRNAGSSGSFRQRVDKTVEKLEASIPAKRKQSEYYPKAGKGEQLVYQQDRGWLLDGVPSVFLEKVDPAKLTRVFAEQAAGITTTDTDAIAAAKAALDELLKTKLANKLAEIRGVMRSKKIEELAVSGPGCRVLINALEKYNNPTPIIALALGIPDPGIDTEDDLGDDGEKAKPVEQLSEQQAATLATGYIAVRAGILKVPPIAQAKDEALRRLISSTPFVLPARSPEGQIEESKKSLKRRLRAAGKQVGDPARANGQKAPAERPEEVLAAV